MESQTSYISRLAEAHFVTVGTLIGKELAPALRKHYLINSSNNGGSRFYDCGFELNGFGTLADDFAKGITELTGCSATKDLTLVNLYDLLPARGVLRHSKAWCSMCLEEWRKSNKDIYEPLLWSFKEANICRRHGVTLKTQCPFCAKEIPVLSRTSRNGFCSFCGCWLGCTDSQEDEKITQEQVLWEHFLAENIESLLEIRDNPSRILSYKQIHSVLKSLIDKAGGTTSFSHNFDIPKTTVRDWYEGRYRPSLKALLQIFYGVGIKLEEFLEDNQLTIGSVLPSDNYYALLEKRMKAKTTKRNFDWQRIEVILQDVIDCEEIPTPSVNQVARNLECDKRLLYNHFPGLCKEISAKHASYVQMRKSKRIEEDCKKIAETTVTLYNSGIYPSRRKVETFLSSILLREKAYQMAWKDALANLGLLELAK